MFHGILLPVLYGFTFPLPLPFCGRRKIVKALLFFTWWWRQQCFNDAAGQNTSQGEWSYSQNCRNNLGVTDAASPDDVQRIARGGEGRL